MSDVLRWIGYGLLALIVLVVVAFAAYRLRGPSRAQLDALALMQKDYRPKQGTNAFPLLWFMRYDVPDGELDARMAAEVAAAAQRLAVDERTFSLEPSADKLTEAADEEARLCDLTLPGCLAKVSADSQSIRLALATYPIILAREKAFEQTDFYWNDFPTDFRLLAAAHTSPAQRVWLSAFALQYTDGDHVGALAGVCRNIGTWRKLRQGSNSLIGSMMAIRNADEGMHLFAEMLAELPAGEAVPAECRTALQPISAADVDRCGEMAGEFAISTSAMKFMWAQVEKEGTWWNRAQRWIVLDESYGDAWRAEHSAEHCGESATRRMLEDAPLIEAATHPVMTRVECIAGVINCMIADIAGPAYIDYDTRTLDFAAHLRLAATLLWLRDSATDSSPAELFEKRGTNLRSGRRNSGFDAQANVVFVDNLHTPRATRFELPISQATH